MNVVVQLLTHHPFDEAAHVQQLWLTSGGLAIAFAGVLAALHPGHPSDHSEQPDIAGVPAAPEEFDLSAR